MRQFHRAFIPIERVDDGLFIPIQQTPGVTTSPKSHVQKDLESVVNIRSKVLVVRDPLVFHGG